MKLFSDIKIGNRFIFDGHSYIKIPLVKYSKYLLSDDYILCNCVRVKTGKLGFVGNSLPVTIRKKRQPKQLSNAELNSGWKTGFTNTQNWP